MSKLSYMDLLKEAVLEYDAKSMDYKGPLTDPILTFDGNSELETSKDASSILERYYFNEGKEVLIEQSEDGPDDPNEIVTGEEADDVDETMDDLESELLEDLELEELNLEDYDPGDPDIVAKDKPLDTDKQEVMNNEMETLENTVIETLIQEMEEETGTEEAGTALASDEEVDKILKEVEALEAEIEDEIEDEKKEKDEEKDEEKDIMEEMEEMKLLEAELEDEVEIEDEKKKKDEEDLNIDQELKEGKGMGPIRVKAANEIEESFRIFREEIEKDEEDKIEDEEDKIEDEENKIEDEIEDEEDLDEMMNLDI